MGPTGAMSPDKPDATTQLSRHGVIEATPERWLLFARWAALVIVLVTAVSTGTSGFPVIALAVAAGAYDAVVALLIRKGVSPQRFWRPGAVVYGLLVVAAILVTRGMQSPYLPLFTLMLTAAAIRLSFRQVIAFGLASMLLLLVGDCILRGPQDQARLLLFLSLNLLALWMVASLARQEASLRLSVEDLRLVFYSFPVGVLLKLRGRLYPNGYVYDLVGGAERPQPGGQGLPEHGPGPVEALWRQLHVAEPSQPDTAGETVTARGPARCTARQGQAPISLPSGGTRIVRYGITPFRLGDGTESKVITLQDVTQELERAESIRQQEHLRLMGTLAAMALHEVRNPLALIRARAQMMATARDPAKTTADAERIISAVDDLGAFLTNIMQLGRRPDRLLRPCSPRELLAEAAALLGPLAESRGARIVMEPPAAPGEPAVVEVDPGGIRQVLVNLAQNALDAMPSGGTVRLEAHDDGESVVLSVHDEGAGISPEDGARIFQPFYTTKKTGTGLGLVISREIVRSHGGDIWFKTTPGVGTTFFVRLPRAKHPRTAQKEGPELESPPVMAR